MVESVEANNEAILGIRKSMRRTNTSRHKDTGLFWDEHLDLYLDGAININLYNNVLGFNSGDTISGTIDIELTKVFDAMDLVIEFKGVERSHIAIDPTKDVLQDYHRESKELISMK